MRPEDTKQMKRDWKTGAQNNNLMDSELRECSYQVITLQQVARWRHIKDKNRCIFSHFKLAVRQGRSEGLGAPYTDLIGAPFYKCFA